jgi:hypothetical protein
MKLVRGTEINSARNNNYSTQVQVSAPPHAPSIRTRDADQERGAAKYCVAERGGDGKSLGCVCLRQAGSGWPPGEMGILPAGIKTPALLCARAGSCRGIFQTGAQPERAGTPPGSCRAGAQRAAPLRIRKPGLERWSAANGLSVCRRRRPLGDRLPGIREGRDCSRRREGDRGAA